MAREAEKAFAGLDDGDYIGRAVDVKEVKVKNEDRIRFRLMVTEGEDAGRVQTELKNWDDPKQAPFVNRRLKHFAGGDEDVLELIEGIDSDSDQKKCFSEINKLYTRLAFSVSTNDAGFSNIVRCVVSEDQDGNEDDVGVPQVKAFAANGKAPKVEGKAGKKGKPKDEDEDEDEDEEEKDEDEDEDEEEKDEDEEEEYAPKKGDEVSFKKGKKTLTGVVKSKVRGEDVWKVDVDGKTVNVDTEDLTPVEEDEEEDADEEDEVEVGSKVTFEYKGKEVTAKVTSVHEDDEELDLKIVTGPSKGKAVKAVPVGDCALVQD
jgi:hypothetical protein